MNFAQGMGIARTILALGGGAMLTANGLDGNAVTAAVNGATTPGGLLLGLGPIVAAGAWSLFAHRAASTIDRAVRLDPQATADAAAAAGATPGQFPRNPTGLSRKVDR